MISNDRANPSPRRDVIVVGGSAGAVDTLRVMLAGLPRGFDAAVLVVVHVPPSSPGRLAEILQRACALMVGWATGHQPLEMGRVYVAPPDRHLVVKPGRVLLTHAPRENHSRPAIDPLFRSAALAYGPRVIGVVVSGRLDDGTAGLWAVKQRGGLAVVQDPNEAAHPDMPRNALAYTTADHVVTAAELGPLLARLIAEPVPSGLGAAAPQLEMEVKIAMEADALKQGVLTLGPPTPYTCPECHGVLVRVEQGGIPRFRCHTGHAFSLGVANGRRPVLGDLRFLKKAGEARERAGLIREAVLRHQALSLESIRASTLELERRGGQPVFADVCAGFSAGFVAPSRAP
jgi:two-component system chemotaxis response regulator CheB